MAKGGATLPSNKTEKQPKEVASLNPPQENWNHYHAVWMQKVGCAKFAAGRESPHFAKNEGDWVYVCLSLKPQDHTFPVVMPHLSLARVKFASYQDLWCCKLWLHLFLWPRTIQGHFTHYGQGQNFLVMNGCELFALGTILRSYLEKYCCGSEQMDRDLHISWNLL